MPSKNAMEVGSFGTGGLGTGGMSSYFPPGKARPLTNMPTFDFTGPMLFGGPSSGYGGDKMQMIMRQLGSRIMGSKLSNVFNGGGFGGFNPTPRIANPAVSNARYGQPLANKNRDFTL